MRDLRGHGRPDYQSTAGRIARIASMLALRCLPTAESDNQFGLRIFTLAIRAQGIGAEVGV